MKETSSDRRPMYTLSISPKDWDASATDLAALSLPADPSQTTLALISDKAGRSPT